MPSRPLQLAGLSLEPVYQQEYLTASAAPEASDPLNGWEGCQQSLWKREKTHTMKSEGITEQSQEWQRCFRATTLVTQIKPIIFWRTAATWHLWYLLWLGALYWLTHPRSSPQVWWSGWFNLLITCRMFCSHRGCLTKRARTPLNFLTEFWWNWSKLALLHVIKLTVEQTCLHACLRLMWDDFRLSTQSAWQRLKAIKPESLFNISRYVDMEFQHLAKLALPRSTCDTLVNIFHLNYIFFFRCPVIWNLSWQSEVLFSLSQFSR